VVLDIARTVRARGLKMAVATGGEEDIAKKVCAHVCGLAHSPSRCVRPEGRGGERELCAD